MPFLDQVKKGLSDAGAKAKEMMEITRLNGLIGQKQKEIEQLYVKIGQAIFKALQDNTMPDEAAVKDFAQEIVKKQQEISGLEQNIADIKSAEGKS